jgi:hypothetical protein
MTNRDISSSKELYAPPANFEIIPTRGIHPFYFGMSVTDALLAATGWKISSVQESIDDRTVDVSLSSWGKEIELCFQYRLDSLARNDALLAEIRSYHCKIPKGQSLDCLSVDALSDFLGEKLSQSDAPVVVDGEVEVTYFANAAATVGLYRNRNISDCFWMISENAYPEGWR